MLTIRDYPDQFVDLSRLFIYYNIRELDGTVEYDMGGYLRDGIKVLRSRGVCREELWPYDTTKFNVKPTQDCYDDAQHRTIKEYQRLDNQDSIVDALNSNKPVVFGMTIYPSFYDVDLNNPVIPMPGANEKSDGGHAMCFMGYDLPRKLFLAKNSFGTDWGDAGYCWVPFDYFREYGYDTWTFEIELK